MANLEYELDSSVIRSRTDAQTKQKQNQKSEGKWKIWVIPISLAIILLASGFFLAKHYIDGVRHQLVEIEGYAVQLNQNVKQVQTLMGEQKENIELLQTQFQQIDGELTAVKEEMSLAGDTLNSSDETKKALSQRIADLSKELDELRKLIKKLEEAARVY